MTNAEKFVKYLRAYVKRDGVEELIQWLSSCTDFFVAPASTKYHLSVAGGLVQHSLNVFEKLIDYMKKEHGDNIPYSKETIAIVSLLHDVGKANMYKTITKNVKDENGNWTSVQSFAVRDDVLQYGGHEDNGIMILNHFLNLTYEESLAIKYHMGAFGESENFKQQRTMNAYESCELAFALNFADMYATCRVESVKSLPDPTLYGYISEDTHEDEH